MCSALLLVVVIGYRAYERAFPAAPHVAAQTAAAETSHTDAQWQQEMVLLGLATTSDPAASSDTDPIAVIGPSVAAQLLGTYAAIAEKGNYTPDELRSAAEKMAPHIRAAVTYKTFDPGDFTTEDIVTTDTVSRYRETLLTALDPLNHIETAEYEMYGRYIETSDPRYLTQLANAAQTYRKVVDAAASITVPRDAVNYHKSILNALNHFAASLDTLVTYADDPIVSVAVLRTYIEAENEIAASYKSMRAYYTKKGL